MLGKYQEQEAGWLCLKHLSFLLASPCGAQIGYFSTRRLLRKHLGFQHLTQSQEQSPDYVGMFQGHCPSSPTECPTANSRPREDRKGSTTNSPRKNPWSWIFLNNFQSFLWGKMYQSCVPWKLLTSTRSTTDGPVQARWQLILLHVNKRLDFVSCLRSKANNRQNQDSNPEGVIPWAMVLIQLPWAIQMETTFRILEPCSPNKDLWEAQWTHGPQ